MFCEVTMRDVTKGDASTTDVSRSREQNSFAKQKTTVCKSKNQEQLHSLYTLVACMLIQVLHLCMHTSAEMYIQVHVCMHTSAEMFSCCNDGDESVLICFVLFRSKDPHAFKIKSNSAMRDCSQCTLHVCCSMLY